MTKEQESARDRIVAILLALPWDARSEVFAVVKYNGIFCAACGWGSKEEPNPHCQCENDE